jgi:hypothetical protein
VYIIIKYVKEAFSIITCDAPKKFVDKGCKQLPKQAISIMQTEITKQSYKMYNTNCFLN